MHQSLSTIEKLCEIYNHPQRSFPTIHVAGTNGKGSVCHKIASALQKGGYRTGLYTSPHLFSFRERIRIDSGPILEEEMVSFVLDIQKKTTLPATFFEIATLLAFLYFQQKEVDVAVIETGLGGRFDATNVIRPLLSIVTSIGDDHKEILGSTLEKIAQEKAGIIKREVPVVLGPDLPLLPFQKRAMELNAPLHQVLLRSVDFDEENQEIARRALSLLLPRFPKADVEEGVKVTPPCRFERHFLGKEVLLDVAHNPHGMERLLQRVGQVFPQHNIRFLVGFSKGKEISTCARLIQEKACAIHLVDTSHPRLASVAELDAALPPWEGPVHLESSLAQGVRHALEASSSAAEVLIITGSFFIMSEAKKALGLPCQEDPFIWYDPLSIFTPRGCPEIKKLFYF